MEMSAWVEVTGSYDTVTSHEVDSPIYVQSPKEITLVRGVESGETVTVGEVVATEFPEGWSELFYFVSPYGLGSSREDDDGLYRAFKPTQMQRVYARLRGQKTSPLAKIALYTVTIQPGESGPDFINRANKQLGINLKVGLGVW